MHDIARKRSSVGEPEDKAGPVPLRRRITGKKAMPGGSVPRPLSASAAKPLRTLVVNLDRRSDRWTRVQAHLAGLEAMGVLAPERFAASDGSVEGDIDNSCILRHWTTDRNSRYDGRPGYRPGVRLEMTSGERGCAMSHVRAWRAVAGDGQSCECEE